MFDNKPKNGRFISPYWHHTPAVSGCLGLMIVMIVFSIAAEIVTLAQIELVIAAASVIAAITGLITVFLYFFDRRVRVKIEVMNIINEKTQALEGIEIWVENIGKRWVLLDRGVFEFPDNKEVLFLRDQKLELAPDKRVKPAYFHYNAIEGKVKHLGLSGVVPFKVRISSTAGKKFRSKKTLLDTETGAVNGR